MSSGDLQALVQAYQAGTMSFETLYFNLQRGDVARPDVDAKAERHAIDAEDGDEGDAADEGEGDEGDGTDDAADDGTDDEGAAADDDGTADDDAADDA